jgi:2-isopropylmalate synthase
MEFSGRNPAMARQHISIFDTTLRDGEQSPGCSMQPREKLRMALQLASLHVDVIEAGFPVASEQDFAAVNLIARTVKGPAIAALCRTLPGDIDRAWEALKDAGHPRIHTFISTSDLHIVHKLQKTRAEVLEMARKGVRYAASLCPDVEFSAEDASRTDFPFLCEIVAAVLEEGAKVVNIPDTVGYAVPQEFGDLIRRLREQVPALDGAVLSVHCHNDLGLAVANSLAAIEAGARQVECTINGIGERAGNASLEELAMALMVRGERFPYETGIVSREIFRTSQVLANITGVHVQPNKAIVGKNAFAHESGIHQHGMLSNPMTYEIMTPESVGVKTSSLVLGKHSGRHALRQRYEELGYPLDGPALDKVYKLFTGLADQKREIYDEDLVALLYDGADEDPEAWRLLAVQANSGTHSIATALVTLECGGKEATETASGDGPVNALCEAINRITGLHGEIQDFRLKSVTHGADAQGEVHVRVHFDEGIFTGKAASTDIVYGSAQAYLDAINKVFLARLCRESFANANANA